MTAKVRDRCKRWRSVTVAFRMSPEENEQLNHFAELSGMTKQDYIIARLLQKEIVVHGNPKVYKALKGRLEAVLEELRRLKIGEKPSLEQLEEIELMANIMKEMENNG